MYPITSRWPCRPSCCINGPTSSPPRPPSARLPTKRAPPPRRCSPSLTLSASYGRGGFDWSTFSSPAGLIWSVGATLSQPVFHGGALLARKHQYEASYDAAVAQYKQTVLAAFQNVADTLVSLDEDANTLTQTRRSMNAAHDATSDTEARYKLGATTVLCDADGGAAIPERAHSVHACPCGTARGYRLAVRFDGQSARRLQGNESA